MHLPASFHLRHRHGGPTLNTVVSGRVEIVDAAETRRYGPGELLCEPAGRPHSITVLADARLDVIRLLPPGVEATTAVP